MVLLILCWRSQRGGIWVGGRKWASAIRASPGQPISRRWVGKHFKTVGAPWPTDMPGRRCEHLSPPSNVDARRAPAQNVHATGGKTTYFALILGVVWTVSPVLVSTGEWRCHLCEIARKARIARYARVPPGSPHNRITGVILKGE